MLVLVSCKLTGIQASYDPSALRTETAQSIKSSMNGSALVEETAKVVFSCNTLLVLLVLLVVAFAVDLRFLGSPATRL